MQLRLKINDNVTPPCLPKPRNTFPVGPHSPFSPTVTSLKSKSIYSWDRLNGNNQSYTHARKIRRPYNPSSNLTNGRNCMSPIASTSSASRAVEGPKPCITLRRDNAPPIQSRALLLRVPLDGNGGPATALGHRLTCRPSIERRRFRTLTVLLHEDTEFRTRGNASSIRVEHHRDPAISIRQTQTIGTLTRSAYDSLNETEVSNFRV
jgi:hypothetical protein